MIPSSCIKTIYWNLQQKSANAIFEYKIIPICNYKACGGLELPAYLAPYPAGNIAALASAKKDIIFSIIEYILAISMGHGHPARMERDDEFRQKADLPVAAPAEFDDEFQDVEGFWDW